jgi:CHRD domain
MNIKNIMAVVAIGGLLFATPTKAATEIFFATLLGHREVPPINSNGTATFHMENADGVITFSLTFSGLSSSLVVAHLHLARQVRS